MVTTLIDRLDEYRVLRDISLAAYAVASGVPKPNISAYKNGRRKPTEATLAKLAAGLDLLIVPVGNGATNAAMRCADEIRAELDRGDEERAYAILRQLSSDLHRFSALAGVMTSEPATPVNSKWDASIAGIVQLRLEEAGHPIPLWVASITRTVEGP